MVGTQESTAPPTHRAVVRVLGPQARRTLGVPLTEACPPQLLEQAGWEGLGGAEPALLHSLLGRACVMGCPGNSSATRAQPTQHACRPRGTSQALEPQGPRKSKFPAVRGPW